MLRITLLAILIGLLAFSAQGAYVGSLSSGDGGLDGTGFWIHEDGRDGWFPAQLSWSVTETGQNWLYSYTLTVFQAQVSHFLLETSQSFTSANLFNVIYPGQSVASIEIGQFTSLQGNPFMPGPIYGVKFDETVGTIITIEFESDRDPVWGNFYAKCGAAGGTQNTVWNSGFLLAAPTDGPSDGSILNHILVPNTIPEPATVVLLGLGSIVLGRRKK